MSPNEGWRGGLRVYLAVSAIGHLLWEAAHVRFYTIWSAAPTIEIVGAVLHCSAGDVLIAMSVLLMPLLALPGGAVWPSFTSKVMPVVLTALALGLAYTVASEWWNVEIRRAWSYAPQMPRLPPLGTGITPVLQWLVVPPLALLAADLQARRALRRSPSFCKPEGSKP